MTDTMASGILERASTRHLAVLLAGFLLVAGGAYLVHDGQEAAGTLADVAASQGVVMETAGVFSVDHRETRQVEGIDLEKIKASQGNRSVTMEVLAGVERPFAEQYIESERRSIESIYISTPQPYGGVPTQEVDCPAFLSPNVTFRTVGAVNYTYIDLYANDQQDFSVCSADAVAYTTRIVLAYCPDAGRVYDVRSYTPLDAERTGAVDSFRCGERRRG